MPLFHLVEDLALFLSFLVVLEENTVFDFVQSFALIALQFYLVPQLHIFKNFFFLNSNGVNKDKI